MKRGNGFSVQKVHKLHHFEFAAGTDAIQLGVVDHPAWKTSRHVPNRNTNAYGDWMSTAQVITVYINNFVVLVPKITILTPKSHPPAKYLWLPFLLAS